MARKLMGRKRGMTQRFDKDGNVVTCTVIEALPNVVTQIRTPEREGYSAVQTAFEPVKAKDERRLARVVGKPLMGHYSKAGVAPHRFLTESRMDVTEEINVGDQWTVEMFSEGEFVDVMATSKGKGFQGVMKLHGFAGGPAAHGSGFHRRAGSTGMRSTPGRCLPGSPRASQMGNRRVTTECLKVVAVDPERNLLLVKGPVPGNRGALVTIRSAVKKAKA